jgi:hypothetical protein
MLYEAQKVFKITAAGTQNVLGSTGYFLAIVASVVTPGTLAITIQDKATTPNKLLPAIDLTPPGPVSGAIVKDWKAAQPVQMDGGIDIVTAGAGEAYMWIWYLFEPEPQV